jgi:hypothetical protein
MKCQLCVAALLSIPVSAALAFHQEKKPANAAATKDDPAMMKMMELATPGAAHKVLDGKVGKWNAVVKWWMTPDAQPSTETGTSEMKWIMDGRFIEDTYTGTMMGGPFHGRGLTGFDNLKKKYVTSWVDTMGTAILHSEGSFDAATKTFSYTGETPDAMAGKYVKTRTVEKIADADHWTMQMYSPGPDGKEFMGMEISFTRAK